ncbi:uncharacterized protein SAMN02745165_01629 [Malonomonas rubra DSM 5091]|uniref:Uncharacterized protein n=1 Tax=Malonomonas rubra DSM 5091 TaxID=1122189 RepID=A0A1M6GPY4_MALRU|nr:ATP-dependent sacrificial sulfur transferase LarE [Malonomonas rubra]SHJ12057.1 uncharacterized protein SAMN02745165_01629 [Malonomonas rubra DSM 5091]
MPLTDKLERLQQIFLRHKTAAVAFSGGVDSTFLLHAAIEQLGCDNVIALTAVSPLFPAAELKASQALAASLGARQQLIEIDLLQQPEVVANQPERCYHCKKNLFQKLLAAAKENNCLALFDGSNLDDLEDYRPGRKALAELQISSPLLEAGLSKQEIRQLSKERSLPTWDKGSFACLASRVPYGIELSSERLQRIERCENWLQQQGFSNYRVRCHSELARIELPAAEINRLLEEQLRSRMLDEFKAAGFTYVTLDLQGFRSGSLNETLTG